MCPLWRDVFLLCSLFNVLYQEFYCNLIAMPVYLQAKYVFGSNYFSHP